MSAISRGSPQKFSCCSDRYRYIFLESIGTCIIVWRNVFVKKNTPGVGAKVETSARAVIFFFLKGGCRQGEKKKGQKEEENERYKKKLKGGGK